MRERRIQLSQAAFPTTLAPFSSARRGDTGAQRGQLADDSRHAPRRRGAGAATPRPSSTATGASSYATLRGLVDDAARALLASGIERGDRVAVWAPNSVEWIVAALGITTAGGVLVPINTRFRGAEAAYILGAQRRAGALHGARVPRHRLPRAARERRRRAPRARAHDPARGRRPTTAAIGWDDFVARGRAVTDARPRRARRVDRRRRPERRRVHVGHHREPEGRRDDARPDAARVPRLVRLGRPARRRPLPHRQPVLPHLRLQGRLPRVPDARRDDLPARGVRRGRRARDRRARAHHGAPRSADDLPLAPRPSRPREPRHLEPARRR